MVVVHSTISWKLKVERILSVCSVLYDFIKEKTDVTEYDEICIVSDSTGG